MRKITLLFLLCTIFIMNTASAMSTNEYVNNLEKTLFGTTFPNQSLEKRIDKIELQIYDKSYSGSAEERLEKIDKIYPRNDFEPNNKKDNNYVTNNNENTTLNQQKYQNYQEDYFDESNVSDYNDYPVISEIEEKIYHRNYKGEDIYKRLSRLETELYGNVKTEQSLQERVSTLKSVLPQKQTQKSIANDLGFKPPIDFNNKSNGYFDSEAAIGEIEVQTFGRTFGNEDLSRRIERLEEFYFGDSISGKTHEDRVNRLASVAMSSKNSPYNSKAAAQWAGILVNLLIIGLGFLL